MNSSKRVAVVTGANKGIGFAIVRALCKQFDGDVYLTARTEANGKEAVASLNKENLYPKFHCLDLNDSKSIDTMKIFLESNYGGLDILVNNAGIAYKMAATEPFSEQAEMSVKTNFWGTLDVCKKFFPLLRPHARVVNVSSTAANFAFNKFSSELQKRFNIGQMTMADVEAFMTEFVAAAKDGTWNAKGWCQSAYGTSKVGVTLMTFVQQRELLNDPREDIVVNACCPGYVATDMSSFKGTKSIDEGADTPVFLAMLAPNTQSPKGNFISDRTIKTFP